MATSGSRDFNLDVGEVIEEAYERCGLEVRTGYDARTARRSLNLMFADWANRGLNLWKVSTASLTLTAGTASYDLPAERVDVIEGLLRTDAGDTSKQTDLTMRRVSISHYAQQTNKLSTGRPIQYWVERKTDNITVHVWPVPDALRTYTFYYYYMERIQDTGKPASNTIDVPDRYLPALVSGLTYYIAQKNPAAIQLRPVLKADYDEQWNLAADASREKASLFITPGGYRTL